MPVMPHTGTGTLAPGERARSHAGEDGYRHGKWRDGGGGVYMEY